MNKEILDALGEVERDYVEEAAPRGRRRMVRSIIAAAAALVLLAGALMAIPKLIGKPAGEIEANSSENPATPVPTARPFPAISLKDAAVAYPEEREYPRFVSAMEAEAAPEDRKAWYEAYKLRYEAAKKAPDMSGFAAALAAALTEGNEGENLVCSPANIYIALAMLAESAEGETREQILSALGQKDMGSLRDGVAALLEAESNDDGASTCLLENSVWLSSDYGYNTETVERLAELYRAAGFWGDPADPDFAGLLGKWIDEKTGGLLNDMAKYIALEPETVFALASTVVYSGSWMDEYDAEGTRTGLFHAPSGDIECEFMHKVSKNMYYYDGNGFIAVADQIGIDNGLYWMIIPDEGRTVEEIMRGKGMELLLSGELKGKAECRETDITVPKIDIASDIELEDAMKALGITDCFDPEKADFSGIAAQPQELSLTTSKHSARIRTDEKGVEAAAVTVYGATNGEPEPVSVTIDRPFAFVITGLSGAPLFMGIVNDPIG